MHYAFHAFYSYHTLIFITHYYYTMKTTIQPRTQTRLEKLAGYALKCTRTPLKHIFEYAEHEGTIRTNIVLPPYTLLSKKQLSNILDTFTHLVLLADIDVTETGVSVDIQQIYSPFHFHN